MGAGADHVIVSPDLDFHWEVLALTDDAGADVVLDTLGSRAFEADFPEPWANTVGCVFIGEMGEGAGLPQSRGFSSSRTPVSWA